MDIREFLEEYKSIVVAAAAFALVIILFFVCLGYSRSMGSSTPRSNSGSFVPGITGESETAGTEEVPGASEQETIEEPVTEAPTLPPIPSGVVTTLEDGTEITLVDETVITTANLNFRSGPSTMNQIIDQIPQGTSLHRTGMVASGWSRVDFNGATGFVSSEYLE